MDSYILLHGGMGGREMLDLNSTNQAPRKFDAGIEGRNGYG